MIYCSVYMLGKPPGCQTAEVNAAVLLPLVVWEEETGKYIRLRRTEGKAERRRKAFCNLLRRTLIYAKILYGEVCLKLAGEDSNGQDGYSSSWRGLW